MNERLPYYVAFLHPPTSGSPWRLRFPDVPGCEATGDDFLGALSNGRETLSEHLSELLTAGKSLPAAGAWEDLQAIAIEEGSHPQFVMPRFIAPKRLRVNISIGADILRQADEWADARGMTRSGLIEVALERHIWE